MSHFTVLIIGEDPESQLEPFDESIEVDEYQRELVDEEEKERFLNTYQVYDPDRDYAKLTKAEAEENKLLSFDELYEKYGDDWNSKSWKKNPEGEWAEFTTYNPLSKWDWYQLGGRWTGFLKLKRGSGGEVGDPSLISERRAKKGWVDQALKKDIDFEGMRKKDGDAARIRYNEVLDVFGGNIPTVEVLWKTIIDKTHPIYKDLTIEEKRTFYHNQPALLEVKRVSEIEGNREKLGWDFDLERYQCTIDEFVQQARDNAISTFAILKDGKWYEKGTMGWWAIVTDEKEQSDWNKEFSKLIDELPDDTLISVYDCHI